MEFILLYCIFSFWNCVRIYVQKIQPCRYNWFFHCIQYIFSLSLSLSLCLSVCLFCLLHCLKQRWLDLIWNCYVATVWTAFMWCQILCVCLYFLRRLLWGRVVDRLTPWYHRSPILKSWIRRLSFQVHLYGSACSVPRTRLIAGGGVSTDRPLKQTTVSFPARIWLHGRYAWNYRLQTARGRSTQSVGFVCLALRYATFIAKCFAYNLWAYSKQFSEKSLWHLAASSSNRNQFADYFHFHIELISSIVLYTTTQRCDLLFCIVLLCTCLY